MAAWRAIGFGLVLGGMCLVPGASGDEETRGPARSGMRAHVDPQTGRLVPPPIGRDDVPPPPARPPLAAITSPNGEITVELDDRFHSRMTATVGSDGKLHFGCVTGDGAHAHVG